MYAFSSRSRVRRACWDESLCHMTPWVACSLACSSALLASSAWTSSCIVFIRCLRR